MFGKATYKMANYRRPPSTYRRLINLQKQLTEISLNNIMATVPSIPDQSCAHTHIYIL